MAGVGIALWKEGRFEEALAWYNKVLPAIEAEHGPSSDEAANILFGIGRTLVRLGRFEESLTPLERHLEIADRVGTPEEIAIGCKWLGGTLVRLKQPARASALLQRALGIWLAEPEMDPPSADLYYLAGCACADKGDDEQARIYLRRATEHPDATAGTYTELARVEVRLRHPDLALRAFNEAISWEEAIGGHVGGILEQAGDGMFRLKRLHAAVDFYQRSATRTRQEQGDLSKEHARVWTQLGHTRRFQGDFTSAAACYEEDLRITRALEGNQSDLAISLHNLGELYVEEMGDVPRGLPMLEEASRIDEALWGPDDPRRAETPSALAKALEEADRSQESAR